MPTRGADARRGLLDRRRQARELLGEILLGVEAAVDREPRRSGHDVEVRAAARCAADDEHRSARLVALERVVRAAREQLVREVGERLGDLHHLRERVDAEMRLPDVRRPALHLDAQRDRAAARVPDDAAGRLGRDHRERAAVDHARLAQVAGAGDAARLLVAHEVQDDPVLAEQAEIARRGGAVEHAHEAALHVGGAAPDDPAVRPLRPELLARLRRDDVEVAVEVDRPRRPPPRCRVRRRAPRGPRSPAARSAPATRLEAGSSPRAATRPQAPEPATRRVLAVDRHERLDELRHLLGARLEPRAHLGLPVVSVDDEADPQRHAVGDDLAVSPRRPSAPTPRRP